MKPDFTQLMLDLKRHAYNTKANAYNYAEANYIIRRHFSQKRKKPIQHLKEFLVLMAISSLFTFLSFSVCRAAYGYIHFTDPVVDVFLIITNYTLAVLLTKKLM